MSAAERLRACVSGQTYAIPKRADVHEVLDERDQLFAETTRYRLLEADLRTARLAAQDCAELASEYARQLTARPSWPEFWAVLMLLPITYTIAALGTSFSVVPYPYS